MITLKQWMELVGYRITEGSEFRWRCYGVHAHALDSWNGVHDEGGHSLSVVFDTEGQFVYEVSAHDYTKNRAYRLINPAFVDAYKAEAKTRGASADEAWDDVNYCDLETVDDFTEKARAIVAGEDYDTTVEVPLNMDKDDLYQLMTMAHERNITFNQLVTEVLEAAVTKAEQAEKDCPVASDEDIFIAGIHHGFVADRERMRKDGFTFTDDEWNGIREQKKSQLAQYNKDECEVTGRSIQSKQWVVEIIEDEYGDLILPFPDDLVTLQGWEHGDKLNWLDNKDGTWSITKAE